VSGNDSTKIIKIKKFQNPIYFGISGFFLKMEQLEQINDMLRDIRSRVWSSMRSLMSRGETTEALLEASVQLHTSSRLFDEQVEKYNETKWQRHCGKGRWKRWVFPCLPIWDCLKFYTYNCRRDTQCCFF